MLKYISWRPRRRDKPFFPNLLPPVDGPPTKKITLGDRRLRPHEATLAGAVASPLKSGSGRGGDFKTFLRGGGGWDAVKHLRCTNPLEHADSNAKLIDSNSVLCPRIEVILDISHYLFLIVWVRQNW